MFSLLISRKIHTKERVFVKKTKNRVDELKDLSIDALVRLWFRKLWQHFDHGGISVGRSLRCDLLDCYLDHTPLPNLQGDADQYGEGLWEEILRRPIQTRGRKYVRSSDIQKCSSEVIALLGLGCLSTLEWSVSARTAWMNGYELERKRIREVLKRFPPAYVKIRKEEDRETVFRSVSSRSLDLNRAEYEIIYQG